MKIFMVEVPIFGVQVVTCTGCTAEEAQNQFYDFQGLRTIVEVPDGRGACLIPGDEIFVWVKDPDNNASTVFHELVHVALGICDLLGMQRDDELVAYLVGWLKQNVADKIFFEETPERKPIRCGECPSFKTGDYGPRCGRNRDNIITIDPSVGVPRWCPLSGSGVVS